MQSSGERSSIVFKEPRASDVIEPTDRLKSLKDETYSKDRVIPDLFISPYEYGKNHRQYKRVFPNRVNALWYRKYADKLPDDARIDFQPFEEVQRVDEDVALQYFYGEDGHLMDAIFGKDVVEKRRAAVQKFNTLKEQEEKDRMVAQEESKYGNQAVFKSIMRTLKAREGGEFGVSVKDKKLYTPIIQYMHKMQLKKRRRLRSIFIKSESRWKILLLPSTRMKIAKMYKNLKHELTLDRFRKVIRLVVCATRFITTIRIMKYMQKEKILDSLSVWHDVQTDQFWYPTQGNDLWGSIHHQISDFKNSSKSFAYKDRSGSTKHILKEIETFKDQQKEWGPKTPVTCRKKMFNYMKYTFKELLIPLDILLTLSKPWFMRPEKEIDAVCSALQPFKSFVQYPPIFQRRLARLAWYTEVEANKYIIRERHIACDFYILLKGRAKEVRLVGDPFIGGEGEVKLYRYIRKSHAFGCPAKVSCRGTVTCLTAWMLIKELIDESMSDPECLREYSIVTCEPCTLLAISVYDYNTMLNTKQDNEIAPEHILFLSNLKLMEDFPKGKLLQEGDENITIHYFRPESLITKNLDASKYVFVVINGACKIVAELPPEKKFVEKAVKDKVDYRWDRRAKSVAEDFLKSIEKYHESVETSRINTEWMRQEFVSHMKKQDSLIEIQRTAISDPSEDFILKGEINDLRLKADQILKTLPKKVRATFNMQNFLKTIEAKAMSVALQNKSSAGRRSQLAPSALLNIGSFMDTISLDKWPLIVPSEPCVHHSPVDEEDDMILLENEDLEIEPSDHWTYVSETTDVVSATSVPKEKSSTDTHINLKPRVKKIKKRLERQKMPDDRSSRDLSRSEVEKRMLRGNIHKNSLEYTKFFSRWKHIRSLDRGDYVGHEWLDFNIGPFEKPREVWSLVSNGCEVIMIKKTFLLKYLRKEW